MPRSALIVDDSRTALASLGRLLKAQGIAVDTAESGPEAIDFLRSNGHPGVIFLDHMMPGMDGFETLNAIKRTAATAAIPVVMYTTQEGDAYMGQALALGAIGLLHKPVNPSELAVLLERVDRLRGAPARPATGVDAPPRAAVTGVINVPEALRSGPPRIETAVIRIPPANEVALQPLRRRLPWWSVAAGVCLLLLSAWYYLRYQHADRLYQAVRDENVRLKAEQEEADKMVTRALPEGGTTPNPALLDTLAWAINQHGQYGFGEEPLNDARLGQVRELVSRLSAAGFVGTVRLETHVGEFCLSRDEQGTLRLPGDIMPFLRCEVITYPPAQAQMLGNRQSPAFARYLAQNRGGPVQVAVVSYGASRPLVSYPDRASVQTAGDWNQIARANQRIEVVLVPAP